MDRPLLYLIDALPYVFRAFFAIREMYSPQGQPVQAVYGFTAFLLQLLRREPVTHIGVAFDESLTSSFRNAFFPAYTPTATFIFDMSAARQYASPV